MSKRIYRIIFTGAPCGGKTESILHIRDVLQEAGYSVFLIRESSTQLYEMGFKTNTQDEIKIFNEICMKFQLYKERLISDVAELSKEPVVILMDRGVLDSAVYLGVTRTIDFLTGEGIDIMRLTSQYDAIIHLQTAAKLSQCLYDKLKGSNLYRQTGFENARDSDEVFAKIWGNYNRVIKIMACENMKDKVNEVKDAVWKVITE